MAELITSFGAAYGITALKSGVCQMFPSSRERLRCMYVTSNVTPPSAASPEAAFPLK